MEEKKYKRVQNYTLIIFVLIVLSVSALLSFSFLKKSSEAIKNNAAQLIAANSRQLQLNINSYLNNVESTAALLFSDEDYYKYDETDKSVDEYTRLQMEQAITNKIVDLGIMENYSDFGIIYKDNYTVGWISNTTKDLFPKDTFFQTVEKNIINEKTDDGWFFGVNGNFDRLYYVKKLNPNAVLLASFYSRELSSVFTFPEELSGMVIRLINDKEQVLYSSEKQEIGTSLSANTLIESKDQKELSITTSEHVLNISSCENGWRVLCEVPADVILADIVKLRIFTITLAIVVAIFAVVLAVILFINMAKPIENMVVNLENKAQLDGLSGLYNKMSFEEKIKNELSSSIVGSSIAFMIMDVDHFKSINDNEGHEYGDQVIVRTAKVLKQSLPGDAIIGRIGGDEFAFLIKDPLASTEEMEKDLEKSLSALSRKFLWEFKEEHEKYNVSVSIGVSVFQHRDEDFKLVYKSADAALYTSKKSGRNQYTFYREGMKGEE